MQERVSTHDADGSYEFFGRLHTQGDNVADEVGGDADDDDHGDDLHDADEQEGLAQRHGTVARDRHLGW